jgi:hypothetical protein
MLDLSFPTCVDQRQTRTPLSVTRTATGFAAEISWEEMEKFLAAGPPERFYVAGVPVSASTDLVREVLCPVVGTSPI